MGMNKGKGKGHRKGNGKGKGRGQGRDQGSGQYKGEGKEKALESEPEDDDGNDNVADDSADDDVADDIFDTPVLTRKPGGESSKPRTIAENTPGKLVPSQTPGGESSNPKPRMSRKRKQGKVRKEAKPLKALQKAAKVAEERERQRILRLATRVKQWCQIFQLSIVFWIWVIIACEFGVSTALLRHLYGGPLDQAWRVEYLTPYLLIFAILAAVLLVAASMWADGTIEADRQYFARKAAEEVDMYDTSSDDSD